MGNSTLESKHYIFIPLVFSVGQLGFILNRPFCPDHGPEPLRKGPFFHRLAARLRVSRRVKTQNPRPERPEGLRSLGPKNSLGCSVGIFMGSTKTWVFLGGKNIGPSHGHLWENRLSNASNLIPSRSGNHPISHWLFAFRFDAIISL